MFVNIRRACRHCARTLPRTINSGVQDISYLFAKAYRVNNLFS